MRCKYASKRTFASLVFRLGAKTSRGLGKRPSRPHLQGELHRQPHLNFLFLFSSTNVIGIHIRVSEQGTLNACSGPMRISCVLNDRLEKEFLIRRSSYQLLVALPNRLT